MCLELLTTTTNKQQKICIVSFIMHTFLLENNKNITLKYDATDILSPGDVLKTSNQKSQLCLFTKQ